MKEDGITHKIQFDQIVIDGQRFILSGLNSMI